MRLKQIRKLADEWIKTLRLGEYNIRFYIKDLDTIEEDAGNSCYGYCESSTVHLEAEISILDPKDPTWMLDGLVFKGDEYTLERRVEEVLLHELVHIFFQLPRDSTSIATEEGSVVRLTRALLEMKYKSTVAKEEPKKTKSSDRLIQRDLYPTSTNLKKDK